MEELLTSFGAQYGFNFFGKQSLIFGETDIAFFLWREREANVREYSVDQWFFR